MTSVDSCTDRQYSDNKTSAESLTYVVFVSSTNIFLFSLIILDTIEYLPLNYWFDYSVSQILINHSG